MWLPLCVGGWGAQSLWPRERGEASKGKAEGVKKLHVHSVSLSLAPERVGAADGPGQSVRRRKQARCCGDSHLCGNSHPSRQA